MVWGSPARAQACVTKIQRECLNCFVFVCFLFFGVVFFGVLHDFLMQCQLLIVIGTPKTKRPKNQHNNKVPACSLDLWFLFFWSQAGGLKPHEHRPAKTQTHINAVPAFSADLCCFRGFSFLAEWLKPAGNRV